MEREGGGLHKEGKAWPTCWHTSDQNTAHWILNVFTFACVAQPTRNIVDGEQQKARYQRISVLYYICKATVSRSEAFCIWKVCNAYTFNPSPPHPPSQPSPTHCTVLVPLRKPTPPLFLSSQRSPLALRLAHDSSLWLITMTHHYAREALLRSGSLSYVFFSADLPKLPDCNLFAIVQGYRRFRCANPNPNPNPNPLRNRTGLSTVSMC